MMCVEPVMTVFEPSTASRQTCAPSTTIARETDETVVLDDDGRCLHGFEHAADPHAAREVDVAPDLGARPDGGPRVDHRPFAHVGADIDVRGHENGSRGDIGAVTGYCMGHSAHAQPVVVAFDVHLVVPFQFAGAQNAHLLDREIEDHGLLDPLVDPPLAAREVDGFGRAQKAPC